MQPIKVWTDNSSWRCSSSNAAIPSCRLVTYLFNSFVTLNKFTGGNNALIDAWTLSDQLATLLSQQTVSSADITRVLTAYEKEMGPRGKKAILGSRKAGEQFHTSSKVAIVMRNTILSMVSWKFNVYEKSTALKWSMRLLMSSLVGAGLYYLVYRFKDYFY